jgi:HEAT repeat protein
MRSKPELKERGLEFGRALQLLLRRCAIYSPDHPSSQGPREQAFAVLSEILESSGRLTFGFAGGRVLINNILTSDSSLRGLRQEFLQRGVAAIVLLPHLAATAFKDFVTLLSITPKALLAQGGAKIYFERNKVEGARVVLPPEHGDPEDVILRADGEQLIAENNWSVSFQGGGTLQADALGHRLDSLLGTAASETAGYDLHRQLESMVNAALSGAKTESEELARLVSRLVVEFDREAPSADGNPTEIASNLVEDLAACWAVDRLSTARSQPEILLTYEDVAETLTRSLATAILLQNTLTKIACLSEQQHLDPSVVELIRRELAFCALPLQEQGSQLLGVNRYSAAQFRQLIATIKALLQRGDIDAASRLAEHYAAVVEEKDVTGEELSRVADLFQIFLSAPNADFFAALRRFVPEAFRQIQDSERHQRVVHLIGLQGHRALEMQDWDSLLSVVDVLETQLVSGTTHDRCCRTEMERLEEDAKLDDALESLIAHRDVPTSSRKAVALCRAFGPRAAEKMTQRLEIEEDASIRLRLVRVIGQSGDSALRVVRLRLADPRWYVVRNACVLLGDLGDPELLAQLVPVLTHADERVQMSAVHTLLRKRIAGREQLLSECLVRMYAPVAEVVLDDLLMMRDPRCLPGLESLLLNSGESKSGLLLKAVQIATVIDSSRAKQLLDKVAADRHLPTVVRRAAALALQSHAGKQAVKPMQEHIVGGAR